MNASADDTSNRVVVSILGGCGALSFGCVKHYLLTIAVYRPLHHFAWHPKARGRAGNPHMLRSVMSGLNLLIDGLV